MLINNFDPEVYGAKLLDFSVGGSDLPTPYLLPPSTLRPVRLRDNIRLRNITLKFDFEADNLHDATANLSELTAILRQEASLLLPDGFHYHCILTDTGSASRKAPWILQSAFTLIGFRHGSLVEETLTESGSIFVGGNYKTEAAFEIETTAEDITVNGITIHQADDGIVLIDGMNKLVRQNSANKFGDCDMTAFPVFDPGENTISISAAATVKVSYYPIYI